MFRVVAATEHPRNSQAPSAFAVWASDRSPNCKGRKGEAKIIAHIAWWVETAAEVKEFYERFKAQGVPIDHCVSHAYQEKGNTVSCYFLDPEGNCLEIYALLSERAEERINRKIDLDKSVEEIVAQASGLPHSNP